MSDDYSASDTNCTCLFTGTVQYITILWRLGLST